MEFSSFFFCNLITFVCRWCILIILCNLFIEKLIRGKFSIIFNHFFWKLFCKFLMWIRAPLPYTGAGIDWGISLHKKILSSGSRFVNGYSILMAICRIWLPEVSFLPRIIFKDLTWSEKGFSWPRIVKPSSFRVKRDSFSAFN